MAGEEMAFWLMMGFSCLVGVFIGYLIFSPRERSDMLADDFLEGGRHDEHDDGLLADTVPLPEPWLTDKATLREQARERALAKMAESEKRLAQEAQAAQMAKASAGVEPRTETLAPEESAERSPYFAPETIKAWDEVSSIRSRRKPGTWVKAEPEDKVSD